MADEPTRTAVFEWAIASAPLAGETASGDAAAVVEIERDEYLIAGIDGLGHGVEAAAAARVAVATVRANPGEPLDNLLLLCHQAMRGTRGAAVTLARVNAAEGELSWTGVGNVEALLVRNSPGGPAAVDGPVLAGGIVGFDLPRVSVRSRPLARGDLLIFATDGIDRRFVERMRVGTDMTSLAEHILKVCSKGTDDALVLAGRYRGRDD